MAEAVARLAVATMDLESLIRDAFLDPEDSPRASAIIHRKLDELPLREMLAIERFFRTSSLTEAAGAMAFADDELGVIYGRFRDDTIQGLRDSARRSLEGNLESPAYTRRSYEPALATLNAIHRYVAEQMLAGKTIADVHKRLSITEATVLNILNAIDRRAGEIAAGIYIRPVPPTPVAKPSLIQRVAGLFTYAEDPALRSAYDEIAPRMMEGRLIQTNGEFDLVMVVCPVLVNPKGRHAIRIARNWHGRSFGVHEINNDKTFSAREPYWTSSEWKQCEPRLYAVCKILRPCDPEMANKHGLRHRGVEILEMPTNRLPHASFDDWCLQGKWI